VIINNIVQVNTPCAEILYSLVVDSLAAGASVPTPTAAAAAAAAEAAAAVSITEGAPDSATAVVADNSSKSLLCLDVCCGTGTIGICCSKANLGVVVGVELCQAAVDDAHLNAELNDLKILLRADDSQETAMARMRESIGEGAGAGPAGSVFVCSRAEAVLGSILSDRPNYGNGIPQMVRNIAMLAQGKKVLAVVDPPREVRHCPAHYTVLRNTA
jgi:tRNA/tmRNA/rRNA uracil-C5-methylase (TrmA/RlmC/RlmD family)